MDLSNCAVERCPNRRVDELRFRDAEVTSDYHSVPAEICRSAFGHPPPIPLGACASPAAARVEVTEADALAGEAGNPDGWTAADLR